MGDIFWGLNHFAPSSFPIVTIYCPILGTAVQNGRDYWIFLIPSINYLLHNLETLRVQESCRYFLISFKDTKMLLCTHHGTMYSGLLLVLCEQFIEV